MYELWVVIGVVAFAVVITALVWLASSLRVRRFLARPSAEQEWRTCFPEASNEELRTFLQLVARAFVFDERKLWSLHPDDTIREVYDVRNALEPDDACELEFLAEDLSQRYGIDLEAIWREDLTLGEVFHTTQQQNK